MKASTAAAIGVSVIAGGVYFGNAWMMFGPFVWIGLTGLVQEVVAAFARKGEAEHADVNSEFACVEGANLDELTWTSDGIALVGRQTQIDEYRGALALAERGDEGPLKRLRERHGYEWRVTSSPPERTEHASSGEG